MQSTVEVIDRNKAVDYLKSMGPNRAISPGHLSDLIGRQQRGEWQPNGADAIVFDTNNELRNGQHRLEMVRNTGIPIEVVVTRDSPVEAFLVYDDGRKRSIGDVLFINRENHAGLLGDALRHVWVYLTHSLVRGSASKNQLIHLLDTHPTIRDSLF